MHKKIVFALAFALCLCANAFAQDKKMGWQLELNKLGLNLTSTDVTNSQEYKDFPNARLTADSQTLVQGVLKATAAKYGKIYLWSNVLLMEYSKNTIKPSDGPKTVNESADNILFTSDYTLRLWHVESLLGGFEAGPFISAAYQTEFNAQEGAPLKKVLRGSFGPKVFEGKYIKSLYAAGVAEEDFTYETDTTKFAWETGLKIEVPVREGVKGEFSGLYRKYVHESKRLATDLSYEAELDARVNVDLVGNISLAPFINYYTAKGKYVSKRGENLYIGVTLSFSKVFLAAK